MPASSHASRNIVAMPAASDEGLSTTVFPATSAAVVMPHRIASGKFHGGMTTQTPMGMCAISFFSPGYGVSGCGCARRSISRA